MICLGKTLIAVIALLAVSACANSSQQSEWHGDYRMTAPGKVVPLGPSAGIF